MRSYITRRILTLPVVMLVVSFIVFSIIALAPGDPLETLYAESGLASQEDIRNLRAYYHLDDPLPVRYLTWLGRLLLKGDFGKSRMFAVPVTDLLLERVPNTLVLSVSALLLGLLLSIPIGIYSAVRQYSVMDYVATVLAFLGRSMPGFWFALMMIMFFSIYLDWLPVTGVQTMGANLTGWPMFKDRFLHALLPVVTMGILQVSGWVRYTRSSFLEVLNEDYLRTARAKGLSERVVIFKHAFRNALIPIVTILALDIPGLFGGAMVFETIFSWPGVGRLMYDAIMNKDFNLALCALVMISFLTIAASLLGDIFYAVVDPRIEYK